MAGASLTPMANRRVSARLGRFLAVFGPGLVVMLADTDVGSVITAGQSGVQWGYRLLLLQLLLVPILYMMQELTVRLAIFTGRGHGELIRDTFGPVWAWVSAIGLGVACVGALLTEFSGVAGVGELYGLPRYVSLPIAAGALLIVVVTGSYRRVERVAIAVGLFELAFFFVAWAAHPSAPIFWRVPLISHFATRIIYTWRRRISVPSSCRGWCFTSSRRWPISGCGQST